MHIKEKKNTREWRFYPKNFNEIENYIENEREIQYTPKIFIEKLYIQQKSAYSVCVEMCY